MKSKYFFWLLRLLAAGIMLQTLYFKFTGQPESIYIFSTLGVEPWGRILSGIVELMASVLLLFPPTTFIGALLAVGTMAGAIGAHVFVLGIEVMGDGGQLFAYACTVLIASLILLIKDRNMLQELIRKHAKQGTRQSEKSVTK